MPADLRSCQCHQHWMSAIVCCSSIFLFTVRWMSLCLCPFNYSPSTVEFRSYLHTLLFFSSSSEVMIFDEVINMTILTVPTFRWWVSIHIPLLLSSCVQGCALAFYTFNCVIVMLVNTALPFNLKCPVMGILASVPMGSTRTYQNDQTLSIFLYWLDSFIILLFVGIMQVFVCVCFPLPISFGVKLASVHCAVWWFLQGMNWRTYSDHLDFLMLL